MFERNLDKGSWTSLLPEIAFYCNNLDNTATKISPHMLTFGQQPRAPIDMLIAHQPSGRDQAANEYVDTLLRKK